MRIEKLHLDRAITASSAPELTHVLSSLGKLSAGIPNPCGYINTPARTHAGRSGPMMTARLGQMVTLGLFRLVDNHYGCPTIRKARPRDPVVKAKAGVPRAADAVEEPPMAVQARPTMVVQAPKMAVQAPTMAVQAPTMAARAPPSGCDGGRSPPSGGQSAAEGRCEIQSNLLKL